MNSSCVFCRIVRGEIAAVVVYESPWAVAILDIAPAAPGHTLLILREHYETLSQVPASLLSAALGDLPRLAGAVMRATGAEGLNVLQNNGRAAGQVIPHVHFHLIPRSSNDGVQIGWKPSQYGQGELERWAQQLRDLCAEAPSRLGA